MHMNYYLLGKYVVCISRIALSQRDSLRQASLSSPAKGIWGLLKSAATSVSPYTESILWILKNFLLIHLIKEVEKKNDNIEFNKLLFI